MRKIILTLFVASSVVFASSCSSNDDESSTKKLSEVEQKLMGTWHTSKEKNDNTYTYYPDGTALYELDITLEVRKESDSLRGAWELVDGNVLIEYYPDVNEPWDNDWKKHPDIKTEIQFANNNTILLKNGNEHYKE